MPASAPPPSSSPPVSSLPLTLAPQAARPGASAQVIVRMGGPPRGNLTRRHDLVDGSLVVVEDVDLAERVDAEAADRAAVGQRRVGGQERGGAVRVDEGPD